MVTFGKGDTGSTGAQGHIGHMGERGPTGDHGQDGRQGVAGKSGQAGVQGRAAPPVLSRIQTIALFLFVVVAFSVLAIRTERNQESITHSTQVACARANQNSATLNSFLDLLIGFTQRSTVLTPSEKSARVQGYQDTKTEPIECP